jgi:hypothetical protein
MSAARPDISDLERMPWPLPRLDIITRSTVYRARVGMKPVFLSLSDAQDYERGHAAYPVFDGIAIGTPAAEGFLDAEREPQMRDDERADRAFEGAQS